MLELQIIKNEHGWFVLHKTKTFFGLITWKPLIYNPNKWISREPFYYNDLEIFKKDLKKRFCDYVDNCEIMNLDKRDK